MKGMVRIPHVIWRGGRPRFEPGPSLRRMGYEGRDLKDDAGRWLSLEAAARFSEQLQAELAARRKVKAETGRMGRAPKRSVAAAPALTTVEALFKAWFDHPTMKPGAERRAGFKPKAESTVAFYRKAERVLIAEAPEIHGAAAGALDKVICFNLYERLVARRGLHVATGAMRTLSAALSFGMRRGLVPLAVNPCEKLAMETPAPRLRIAEREGIAHLVGAADALGRPEIGDAIMLGVWTAQRQADRLALVDEGLLNGRRYFRQRKTGAIVAIPEPPMLAARLAAARERRKPLQLQHLELVINERDNTPWAADHYRKVFHAIVEAAARGVAIIDGRPVIIGSAADLRYVAKYLQGTRPASARQIDEAAQGAHAWLIRPMPSLAGFHDQDLRDTAVTWLAMAGATVPEICAVTGHSLETATSILKHYLERHPELADHAIAKLVAWHG